MDEEPPEGPLKYFNPAKLGFRWGGGVVSNTTFMGIVALAVLGLVTWSLSSHPYIALAADILIVGAILVFWVGTWIFAARYPNAAVLGGPEYVRIREAEMGTKEHPHINAVQNVEASVMLEGARTDGT